MADQPSVFASDQTPPPNQTPEVNTPAPKGDTLPQSAALLVGEGRKYKTLDDLVKAHLHLDDFAETLKSENATLREASASSKTIEDVLKRLEAPPSSSTPDRSAETAPKGLSAEAVAAIVRNELTGMETARTQAANLLKADALLKHSFGDKAKAVFDKEASTPEMRKALMALAAVSPEKFVAVFGATSAVGSSTDGSTSVNTAALNDVTQSGRALDPGCKEHYDAMRRNPKTKDAYYSATVQLQMNRAAQADRNKFFGTR